MFVKLYMEREQKRGPIREVYIERAFRKTGLAHDRVNCNAIETLG
jgi:hypothetical protein